MKPDLIKRLTANPSGRKPVRIGEETYEVVSIAVMQGNAETLNDEQRRCYERLREAYSIVCDTPIKKEAVNKLQALHPEISTMQAYRDIDYAVRIWNPKDRYDRGFLETVLVNELIRNIKDPAANEDTRAKNLATLQRFLSSMPQEPTDPTLMEKNTVNITININGNTLTIPADKWSQIKENSIIAAALDQEITEAQAAEIMEG